MKIYKRNKASNIINAGAHEYPCKHDRKTSVNRPRDPVGRNMTLRNGYVEPPIITRQREIQDVRDQIVIKSRVQYGSYISRVHERARYLLSAINDSPFYILISAYQRL